MKPESQPYNGGEFQGDSTYKQTFVPKAVPYERFKPKHAEPPTGVSSGGFLDPILRHQGVLGGPPSPASPLSPDPQLGRRHSDCLV